MVTPRPPKNKTPNGVSETQTLTSKSMFSDAEIITNVLLAAFNMTQSCQCFHDFFRTTTTEFGFVALMWYKPRQGAGQSASLRALEKGKV